MLPLPCRLSAKEASLERTSGNVCLQGPFGLARKWESSTQSSTPRATDKGVNQKPVQLGLLLPASSGPATSNTFHCR